MLILLSADFLQSKFFKNYFRNIIKGAKSLDPYQDRHSVCHDQGPTYLQRLSADDKSLLASKQYKLTFEPVHEISNNVVCATIKASDQPAHTRSLIRAFASRLSIL